MLDELAMDVPAAPQRVAAVLVAMIEHGIADFSAVCSHALKVAQAWEDFFPPADADAEPEPEAVSVVVKLVGELVQRLAGSQLWGGEQATAAAWSSAGLELEAFFVPADGKLNRAAVVEWMADYAVAAALLGVPAAELAAAAAAAAAR